MNFRTIFVLLLTVLAASFQSLLASQCQDGTINRADFIRRVYTANLKFVQKGVPSRAVDSFFRHAIVNVIHKCSCNHHQLELMCTRLHFGADDTVRTLLAIVTKGCHYDQQVGRIAYFPLYHNNHIVAPLTPELRSTVENHEAHLIQFLAPLNAPQISLVQWNEPIFPSEDLLFRANATTMSQACHHYNNYITPSTSDTKRNITAKNTIAFALGVVQVIRYASGNVRAAHELLSEHTRYIYNAAICLQKSRSQLTVPDVVVAQLVKSSKRLLSIALEDLHNGSPGDFLQLYQYHLPAPAEMENMVRISEPPLRLFGELVDQLASICSGGLAATYLDFETSKGTSLTVRLTEDLLSDMNPYKYLVF